MGRRSGYRPRVVFRTVIMILNFTPQAMGSPGRLLIGCIRLRVRKRDPSRRYCKSPGKRELWPGTE